MKLAPCQYQGSAYLDNMILAGHNYRAHFAGLKDIQIGDAVIFTDAEDSCFHYEVSGLEELPGTAICEMESGDWDLTLHCWGKRPLHGSLYKERAISCSRWSA